MKNPNFLIISQVKKLDLIVNNFLGKRKSSEEMNPRSFLFYFLGSNLFED